MKSNKNKKSQWQHVEVKDDNLKFHFEKMWSFIKMMEFVYLGVMCKAEKGERNWYKKEIKQTNMLG